MELLCFGDSITRGHDVPVGLGWVELVSAAFPAIQVENYGVDGDTLQGMMYRLERLPGPKNGEIRYITIMGATNDILMGRDSEYCLGKLKQLISLIHEKEGIPIVGMPPQIDGDLGGLNQVMVEYVTQLRYYCEVQSTLYIDFYKAIETITTDGTVAFAGEVHPNRLGYAVMGETAISLLTPILR